MSAPAVVNEWQQGGLAPFLRACRAAAWLEYRNLRYYPTNLLLAAVQEITTVGVWYFVARFLRSAADASVAQYGGIEAMLEVDKRAGGPQAPMQFIPSDDLSRPLDEHLEDFQRLMLEGDCAEVRT
jgi:hypothetical protein